jgi:hypothetical protein
MVLSMDKKSIKKIERIFRRFLWVGRASADGGHCHAKWSRVCRPLHLGGLGISDLGHMTISLRVRWLWKMRTDPLQPWRGLDMHFSMVERHIFDASTYMVLGNDPLPYFGRTGGWTGCCIQDIVPDLVTLIPRRPRKRHTVREALVERSWITEITGAMSALALWQYVQVRIRLRSVQLSVEPDRLVWR